MVASILRLRLTGLLNAIRHPRSPFERGSIVVAFLIVIVAVIGILALGSVLGDVAFGIRRLALVTVGSGIVLGFWALPLLFAADDGLAPRAFASFGVRPRRLAVALAVGGLSTIPVALLVVLIIVQIGAWRDAGPGVLAVAVLSGVLVLAMSVLGARVASAVASEFLSGIAARSLTGLSALSTLAVGAPTFLALALADWSAFGVTELRRWVTVLSWTPWGAAWSVPGDVAAGDSGLAWVRLAIAVVTVAVLWVVWELLVRRIVARTVSPDVVHGQRGIGVFGALPASQAGAVAARSLVYWMRDPRYAVPPLILPAIPLVLVPAFLLAGVPAIVTVWLPVPLMCLVLGWLVHNDVSNDGTAFWLHVVTGVSGRADRWGRVAVPLAVGIPLAIGGSIASAAVYGDLSVAVPLASLSLCALLSGLGVASAASARSPYPSVAPGDHAFAQPQELGDGHSGIQGWILLLATLACLPTVALIVWALVADPGMMVWASVSGVAIGLGVLFIGIELGARVVTRAAPELLSFARSN